MADEHHEEDECTCEYKGWWTLSAQSFIDALRAVEAGETAENVYMEWYANSDIEDVEGDDD